MHNKKTSNNKLSTKLLNYQSGQITITNGKVKLAVQTVETSNIWQFLHFIFPSQHLPARSSAKSATTGMCRFRTLRITSVYSLRSWTVKELSSLGGGVLKVKAWGPRSKIPWLKLAVCLWNTIFLSPCFRIFGCYPHWDWENRRGNQKDGKNSKHRFSGVILVSVRECMFFFGSNTG